LPYENNSLKLFCLALTQLLAVATRDFAHIKANNIDNHRRRYRVGVVHNVEDINRKSQIRDLEGETKLNFTELGYVYDEFKSAKFSAGNLDSRGMTRKYGFCLFIIYLCHCYREFLTFVRKWSMWGLNATLSISRRATGGGHEVKQTFEMSPPEPSWLASRPSGRAQVLMGERLFKYLETKSTTGVVDFASTTRTLATISSGDLHAKVQLFFDLHDTDHDGFLTHDDVTQMVDSFLVLFRDSDDDHEEHMTALSSLTKGSM